MKNLVIIPAFNEEEALPRTVQSLQKLPDSFEVVIINDGSVDRTAPWPVACGRQPHPHQRRQPAMNGGIGVAVQTGYASRPSAAITIT